MDLEDLRLAVYRSFARTGRPPRADDLAEQLALDVATVRAGLAELARARRYPVCSSSVRASRLPSRVSNCGHEPAQRLSRGGPVERFGRRRPPVDLATLVHEGIHAEQRERVPDWYTRWAGSGRPGADFRAWMLRQTTDDVIRRTILEQLDNHRVGPVGELEAHVGAFMAGYRALADQ